MILRLINIFLFISVVSYSTVVTADFREIINIKTDNAGNIPFSHENHLKSINNNCAACHNSVYHIIRKNNPRVTMAEMEKGKSCGACHNKDNPKNPQLADCSTCHKVDKVSIIIPDFGTLVFEHNKHLGMFSCADCHDGLFKADKTNVHSTMSQMQQGRSCGACHDGKSAFSVTGDCVKCHKVSDIPMAGGSVFSHSAHLEMSFSCSECHNKIFVPGPNRISNTMLDMESGKSCGACHNSSTAFSVKGDCQKCHKNVSEITFKAFDARFSHVKHLEMFKCDDCHSAIFFGGNRSIRYTMPEMEKGKSCGACHDGKSAFGVNGSCEKCHFSTPDDTLFKIKDAGTVSFSHSIHREMYACTDCHNGVFTTGSAASRFSMGDMEKGKSCGTCHEGKTAFPVSDCSRCHPVKEVLFSDDARFNHDKHLSMYSCSDCHNKLFSAGHVNKRFTMTEMEKGESCGSCHNSSTAFSVKGDCDKCHNSTVDAVFKVKETGDTIFSHNVHKSMFSCTECHNGIFKAGKESVRAKMSDMENGKSCGACHDGQSAFGVKNDCQKCHTVKQINFRSSSAVFSHTVHIAAYSCKDCHPDLFIPASENKRYTMEQMEQGKSCGSCHDDSSAFSVKGNCIKCHPGTPLSIRYELSANTGNVDFVHKPHFDKGYVCKDCHYSAIPSGTTDKRWVMKEMDQGKFCGACHGFSMAFSVKDPLACERCHQKESDWRPQRMQ
ncbi:MAG: cytochrome c3 family protein [Desulfuromonadaceae bacterium]|nr:cytochrome c3 family protein [Desulfuromonadaceae bacterium]MDD2855293.1 cytochrome c3 family protein [Desulfuromonadaceae bacterium]